VSIPQPLSPVVQTIRRNGLSNIRHPALRDSPVRPRRTVNVRSALLLFHRWNGLFMAAFLAIIGVTGSLLAFNTELERVFAPQLFANVRPGVAPLDLATLATRAEALVPGARVRGVVFTEPDHVQVYTEPKIDPSTGRPYDLGFDELYLDPWTGAELGRRMRGDLSQGIINLMPFVYEVHWTLTLGNFGWTFFGILAVLWTLDCFVGFYLTLPRGSGGFWRRWRVAWEVKWSASSFRVNLDLHRAAGLWLWIVLLFFAWSSVMMNLRPVYERVIRIAFDYQSPRESRTALPVPNERPRLNWHSAESAGEKLMAEQATLHGFQVEQPLGLAYNPETGTYTYEIRSSRDVFRRSPKGGSTYIELDGNSGEFVSLFQPTGVRRGNTVESWLYALHMARVFGRPYQIFVCVLGLFVTMLSVTGVYIWWRKREVRRFTASQAISFANRRAAGSAAIPTPCEEGQL